VPNGEPIFPGVVIRVRALGMFRISDDKVLCVPAADPRVAYPRELEDVSAFDRLEIAHFFEVYKDLEPGKSVDGAAWADRTAAEAEIIASRQRAVSPASNTGAPGIDPLPAPSP
jgi:inorganic pyrophosphatase